MAKNDDVIAKIKAEEAAKAEAAEKERIAKEQEKLDPDANNKPTNEELAKAAADASAKIEQAEKDEKDIPVVEDDAPKAGTNNRRRAEAMVAGEKLKVMAMSYPRTTPNEHIIFGVAGYKFTLGDLRVLTNIE